MGNIFSDCIDDGSPRPKKIQDDTSLPAVDSFLDIEQEQESPRSVFDTPTSGGKNAAIITTDQMDDPKLAAKSVDTTATLDDAKFEYDVDTPPSGKNATKTVSGEKLEIPNLEEKPTTEATPQLVAESDTPTSITNATTSPRTDEPSSVPNLKANPTQATAAELVIKTPSEFQSLKDNAERHCDLMFLQEYQEQERTTEHYKDYRCFALLLHETYGLLLLHCTTDSKKGSHYQVPGGRVKKSAFLRYENRMTWAAQRYLASRESCAEHIEEQTGLSIPPARLWPVVIRKTPEENFVMNEHKQRLFFVAHVSDANFLQQSKEWSTLATARNALECPLRINLSEEHSGFRMEQSVKRAMGMLKNFNGGRVTKVLGMALKQDDNPPLWLVHDTSAANPVGGETPGTHEILERNGLLVRADDPTLESSFTELASAPSGFQRLINDARQETNLSFVQMDDEMKQVESDGGSIRYKGFVFVLYEPYGMLLLHSTKKAKKGPHYQIPGGNVEDFDFGEQYQSLSSAEQNFLATRAACLRHLQESVGLAVSLDRLRPITVSAGVGDQVNGVVNTYRERLFFALELTDDDLNDEQKDTSLTQAQNDNCAVRLRLSSNYSGFCLENNTIKAIELLEHFSGGHVSKALWMALKPRK